MLLTLFAIPKPFSGHIALIQRNAIHSWTLLRPAVEIILFGDEPGTAEVAGEFGLRHIPQVARTEFGTPLLNALFETAERVATGDTLAYVNADIILMSDFGPAVRRVAARKRRFLVVGRRWDVDLAEGLDFRQPDWEKRLRTLVQDRGQMHGPAGLDYFVFPRGLWPDLPPFALGRTAWDNWLVYRARSLRIPVVDATACITAIHQNHDYAHFPGGRDGVWKGEEARRNLEMAGGYAHLYTVLDANWLLTPHRLRPAWTREHLRRRCERYRLMGEALTGLGFDAYREGRPHQAARYLLRALPHRPSLLGNRGVLSILAEALIGTPRMSQLRSWRRKWFGP